MLNLDDRYFLSFVNMGLFSTDSPWIHPTVTVSTFELIYVLEGDVRIFEGDRRYKAKKGDLLLLEAGTEHGGFGAPTTERTVFYWLHFHTPDINAWNISGVRAIPDGAEKFFREMMHDAESDNRAAELRLAYFLLNTTRENECKNRQIYEVQEFIRLRAENGLTVADVAARFNYSPDYLSKVYKKEFGIDLKSGIDRQRIEKIQNRLLNTSESVKQIAFAFGFADENLFVKYFRYHTGISPTTYRNRFFRIHRNEK